MNADNTYSENVASRIGTQNTTIKFLQRVHARRLLSLAEMYLGLSSWDFVHKPLKSSKNYKNPYDPTPPFFCSQNINNSTYFGLFFIFLNGI
jgi:hypothetical protein